MSYGIIRVQKIGSGGVGGIQIHNQREKEYSHSNKDIDFEKTELNYDLKNDLNINYRSAVKKRIEELNLPKKVRKDAKVMCQFLVTSDKTFFEKINEEEQKQYFEKSYNWIAERYGKGNIISATVHLDESTPHMHVNFVPVTKDGRLCAKDLFERNKLYKLHDDFYKDIGKQFGLNRGETREDKRRHLGVEEFKVATKKEEIKESIYNLSKSVKELDKKKFDLEIEKNKLDNKMDSLQNSFNSLQDKERGLVDISSIKTSKSVLGGKITLSQDDYNKLIDNAKLGILLNGVEENYISLNEKYNKLKKDYDFTFQNKIQNVSLKINIDKLEKDKELLNEKVKELVKFINSKELVEEFLRESKKSGLSKKIKRYER